MVARSLFLIAFVLTWSVAEDIIRTIAMERPDADAGVSS